MRIVSVQPTGRAEMTISTRHDTELTAWTKALRNSSRAVVRPLARTTKKTIDIFNYNHWLLSIDMKTKVVQHVDRE